MAQLAVEGRLEGMQQGGVRLGRESVAHVQGLGRNGREVERDQHAAIGFVGGPLDDQHGQGGEPQQARGGRTDQEIPAVGAEHQQIGIDGGGLIDDRGQQLAAGQVQAGGHAMRLAEFGRQLGQRFLGLFAQLRLDLVGFLAEQLAQFIRGALAQGMHQGEFCAQFGRQAECPVDSRSGGIHQVGGRENAGRRFHRTISMLMRWIKKRKRIRLEKSAAMNYEKVVEIR